MTRSSLDYSLVSPKERREDPSYRAIIGINLDKARDKRVIERELISFFFLFQLRIGSSSSISRRIVLSPSVFEHEGIIRDDRSARAPRKLISRRIKASNASRGKIRLAWA